MFNEKNKTKQKKKPTLIKAHNFSFYEALLCQTNLPFSTFSPRSSLLPRLNNVGIMLAPGQRGRRTEGLDTNSKR